MAADTFSNTLGYLVMGTGNDNNSWGSNANASVFQVFEDAIANALTNTVTGGTLDLSGSPPPAGTSQVRYAALIFNGGLTGAQTIQVPNLSKFWWVQNATSGALALTMQTPTGTPVTIPQNSGWQLVYCDGANNIVVMPFNSKLVAMPDGSLANPSFSFANDLTMGMARLAASQLGLVVGSDGIDINTAGSIAASAIVAVGGANYALNDTITIGGGNPLFSAVFKVASLTGSAVATVSLLFAGRYFTTPANPAAQSATSGAGTGCTLNVTYSAATVITDPTGTALWQKLGASAFMASLMTSLTSTAAANALLTAGAVLYASIQNVTPGFFLGGALTAGAAAVAPAEDTIPFGQCRLAKSGANLVLSPYKGSLITINSAAVRIPDAGVSLATTSLSSGQLYYIYAFLSAGVMTLEASITAYATQAGTGVTIKTGDATRTLVGMAQPTAGPAWTDTATQRLVRSWFNDPGIGMLGSFSTGRSTSSASFVELNSEIRVNFLVWTGEVVALHSNGSVSNNAATANTSIGIDGIVAEDTSAVASTGTPNAFSYPYAVSLFKTGLSEGFHFATLLGNSAGTSTWSGSGTAGTRSTLTGFAKLA